jgi:hypothetical protein
MRPNPDDEPRLFAAFPDDTFERITNIDPKIQVLRSEWGEQRSMEWYCQFKNEARKRCTGDWCVYLDCDEFIPEWQFDSLRRRLADTSEDLIAIDVINFYANYRVSSPTRRRSIGPRGSSRSIAIGRTSSSGATRPTPVRGQNLVWPERPYDFAATISATSGMRRGFGRSGAVRTRSIGPVDSRCRSRASYSTCFRIAGTIRPSSMTWTSTTARTSRQ